MHPAASKGFAFASIASRCQFRFAGEKTGQTPFFWREEHPAAGQKTGQTPFIQETSSVRRSPSSEKSVKSGRSVLRPSSKIMDPSFERAKERYSFRCARPGQAFPSRHPGNLLARIPTFPTQKERRSEIPYKITTG